MSEPHAKTAAITWSGEGLRFETVAGSGGGLTIDSGAAPAGMGPMEAVLAALGACTAMDVISILGKKRQGVAAYRIEVHGQQRAEHPRTFEWIVVEHLIEGRDCTPEAVRRSVELSATRYCPVTAHLAAGPTRIEHRFVLREAGEEHSALVVVTGPHGAGLAPIG